MNEGGLLNELRKRWFIVSLVLVILLARSYPYFGSKEGPLHPAITVKYIAVSTIFFNSGLSLKTEEFARAISQVRLHLFIQCYTLILIPIIMTLLVSTLKLVNIMESSYLQGLHVVGCMPPPVSSAVILTKAVGGNEAGAIFNSALGSFLGIIVTPLLLLSLIGTSATVPFRVIFTQLSLTVLVPLVAGQICRVFAKKKLEEYNPPFGTISSCILLLIIYTTFCDTFSHAEHSMSAMSVMQVAVIVFLCQSLFLSLAFFLTTSLKGFSRQDIIAVLFCSTHKSLTLGIPILKIIFENSPQLSSISLPLLVYHPTQIILGSILVPWLQDWVVNGAESASTSPMPIPPATSLPSSKRASPILEEV